MAKADNKLRKVVQRQGKQSIMMTLFLLVFVLLTNACSVKKNTSLTRFYHNMTTRYNVYYNGKMAFDEAYKKNLEELEESYVELIPYSPIYYNALSENALGTYQRAIEKAEKAIQEHSLRTKPKRKRGWKKDPKAVAMQAKKEYNTYLKNAWFLLAKSQYYNAEFEKSLSSFAYIANLYKSNEVLYTRAMLWQVRVLTLLDRTSEAGEILKSLVLEDNKELQKKIRDLYPKVLAEYYLQKKDFQQAVQELPLAIKATKNKVQKARLYYLLGQLTLLDSLPSRNPQKAYEYFSKVTKLSPPQGLDFAARLKKSELSPKGQKENIRLLKRMSHKRRYRKHLDQIYYALGNTYLSLQDSTEALKAYQIGADSSQIKQYDYLLNLMALGRVYLTKEKWLKAQTPISEVASKLSNTHRDYAYYQHLSKGLDSLIIPAQIVYEKDSLLRLARMPKQEVNAIIDKRIEEVKKKEKAERQEAYKEENSANSGFNTTDNAMSGIQDPMSSFEKGKFYFYNNELLARGRRQFGQKWGKRKLEDFWNLRKKSGILSPNKPTAQQGLDSLSKEAKPSADEGLDFELSNNPHERSYYLANIPFSKEAQAEAKAEIGKAMLEEARILRDKLEFLPASYRLYKRYAHLYPQSEQMDEVLYHSYLLALRLNLPKEAEHYRLAYLSKYPKTALASKLADKNYLQNLRQTDKLVSKYYEEAYEAYLSANASKVEALYQSVKRDYPKAKLYPRFVFLSAMAKVINGEQKAFQERLQEFKTLELDKDVMTLASSMLSEVQKGRRIIPTSPTAFKTYTEGLGESPEGQSLNIGNFKEEDRTRNLAILLMIPKEVLTEAELIYYVSLYNFVHHTQENLELRSLSSAKFSALMIQRFRTNETAQTYIQDLQADKDLARLKKASYCFVSIPNSKQIISLEDYQVYLNFLKQQPKQAEETKQKLNYLSNPPKIEIPKTEVKIETKAKQSIELPIKAVEGKQIKEVSPSYEDMEAIAKEREKEKRRLAKQRLKEKEARLKARKQERKAKLKERRRLQKEKEKARKKARKAKEKERRRLQKEKEKARKKARKAKEKERHRLQKEKEKARKLAQKAKKQKK